ncbi:CPBP family intramembrane glutamic endopeptidase [Atopobacter phocae]|uniref:CPBP family intramembrane glutamic endopeptidase n=1 Tax=Atopobacter phocae TaxID=136492 RepID=UPI00146FB2AA|nr:CPBP family intramembrane glutamic endopeptidase [Atopobacter phocae]
MLYSLFSSNPLSIEVFSEQYGDFFMLIIIGCQFLGVLLFQYVEKVKFERIEVKQTFDLKLFIVSFIGILSLNYLTYIFVSGFEGIINEVGYTMETNETDFTQMNWIIQMFSILYTVVGAPVIEEIIYRGVIARQSIKISPAFGIILSALLFSGMHANLSQMSSTFLIGLVLGLVYYVTGNLLLPICLHMANNLWVTLMDYWPIDMFRFSLGGLWSVFEELFFYTLLLLIACIAIDRMIFYMKRDYHLTWEKLIKSQWSKNNNKEYKLLHYFYIYFTLISTYIIFSLYWLDMLFSLNLLE